MARALQLTAPRRVVTRPLTSIDLSPQQPGPGEVAIAVSSCAVCRTDLQIVTGDLAARRLPIVPGHQIVGRVTTVGEGVDRWSPGDRVGVGWLAATCGECRYCTTGRENLCAQAEFTGWDRDGGFATHTVARADFAYALPEGCDDLHAAPLLCGGIIGFRALEIAGAVPGTRVGLYGFGASARLALQVAVHRGCEVFVTTRSPADRDAALESGAVWAGSYYDRPPAPLDAAVTFAPVGYVVVEALEALAPGETVAVNAIHLDRIPEFTYDLLWRERGIRSVANFTREDARRFLELAAAIPIRTRPDPYPLADANLALLRLEQRNVTGAAVLTVDEE